MSFSAIDPQVASAIARKLENLSKSFSAGYQGLSQAGRTGISALAKISMDPVLKSITMQEKDFYLTKDIPTLKATQSTFHYKIKTAVRSGTDLAGFEAFLPQDSSAQYLSVAEVLKVYGIRKHITEMAELINDASGYDVDLQKENDETAALAMGEAMERDLYHGGDMFINPQGQIDSALASNLNIPMRNIRGIFANISEGDNSQRGIPGDFIGYGNNRSVVHDNKGGVIDRKKLDEIVTSVADNGGRLAEAHCTSSQAAEFRATFFPIERADINSLFAIQGPNVTNDEQVGFSVGTTQGSIKFIPTRFKYTRYVPSPVIGSNGQMPSTPVIASAVSGASVIGNGSGFIEGQTYQYRVQSKNINGISYGSSAVSITIASGNDNKPVELSITNVAGAESYMVFRTPVESDGKAGTEMFIGNVWFQGGASTKFVDNDTLKPGLDGVLFMPKDENRAKLATLGNLMNKNELGRNGLATEVVYSSYFGCVVQRPRSFAILRNVFQKREVL